MTTVLMLFLLGWLSACAPAPTPSPEAQLANPASVYCLEQGGMLTIEKLPNGGEYGVCTFPDGRACEEWAMFRGECPTGEVDLSAAPHDAARYCLLRGGEYQAAEDQCLYQGQTCPSEQFYQTNRCQP